VWQSGGKSVAGWYILIFLYLYSMTTITLQVPDTLGEYQNDTVRFIAAKLYESGKLSLGQAAEMAGLSKRTFAELLGDYNVSLINYSLADIVEDAAKF
jgi:predicted HTH domain antitoxin